MGCFVAEMFIGKPLFPGKSELDQLPTIFDKLGVPTNQEWSGVEKMPGYQECVMEFKTMRDRDPTVGKQTLHDYLTFVRESNRDCTAIEGQHLARHLDDDTIDLIAKMLTWDPARRLTAREALDHALFTSEPLPCTPEQIPVIEGELKELNFRQERHNKIKMAD